MVYTLSLQTLGEQCTRSCCADYQTHYENLTDLLFYGNSSSSLPSTATDELRKHLKSFLKYVFLYFLGSLCVLLQIFKEEST
jgi:hypothetical protein